MRRDIIVIGGSAGSGKVLRRIVSGLPRDLPAAVFISTHIPSNAPAYLAETLTDHSPIPIAVARDGDRIERGRIYLAPANCHLLLFPGGVRLGVGPRENMARPAIDPLFRSAALAFGPRVIGVVLSGYLADGAAGLHAVGQCGGVTIVQHPAEAQAHDMPTAALEAARVDHVAAGAHIAPLLSRLTAEDAGPAPTHAPLEDIELEVLIALGERLGAQRLANFATPTPLSCPQCHGVLSEIKDDGPLRFRCQTGHAYNAEAALIAQEPEVQDALRIALRVIEERSTLVTRMAEDARGSGRHAVADMYESRGAEYARYAKTLRDAATLSLRSAHELTEGA